MKRTAIFFLLATSACSDDDASSGGAVTTVTPAALSAYCTVQSTAELKIQTASGPNSWSGNGTRVPAGTTFYLSEEAGGFAGYVVLSDGTPALLVPVDDAFNLTEGTHFSGSCTSQGFSNPTVFLRDATLYATQDLVGEPCKLPIGTELQGYGYAAVGEVGQVSSQTLQDKCGYTTAFSKDVALATLIRK